MTKVQENWKVVSSELYGFSARTGVDGFPAHRFFCPTTFREIESPNPALTQVALPTPTHSTTSSSSSSSDTTSQERVPTHGSVASYPVVEFTPSRISRGTTHPRGCPRQSLVTPVLVPPHVEIASQTITTNFDSGYETRSKKN